jgi:hypothetical protein
MPCSLLRAMPGAALVPLMAVSMSLSLSMPAQADSLLVAASGVFTPETPVLPFSAPGATWSFTFIVDRNPVPILGDGNTLVDFYVSVPFSEFRMLVNGIEIEDASQVTFYSGSNGGGMDIIFGTPIPDVGYQSLGTWGDGYYSGSELAPVIEPGMYTTYINEGIYAGRSGIYVTDFGANFWQPQNVVTISAVPNPATAALLLGGLAVLGLRRGRRAAPARYKSAGSGL